MNRREQKVQQMALLQGEDPFHLLLHLIDIALGQGILEVDATLDSICDAAAIATCGPWRTDISGKLWLAIINIGGAIVSRYSHSTGKRLALVGVELARIVISMFAQLPLNAQHALLALVYALNNSRDCSTDACISDLVRQCAIQCNSPTKRAVGQLLLKLYESGKSVPGTITNNILALASDFDCTVRAVWIQLADRIVYRLYTPPLHPFAVLQQCLRNNTGFTCHDHIEINRGASRMSLADAMSVVQAVVECASEDTSVQTVSDCGFGDRELSIIETIYRSSGLGNAKCSDILLATNASIAASARRIRAADSMQSCCLPLVTYLVDVVKSTLAKRTDANSGILHGLYWILELIFHLCSPKTTAAAVLHNDVDIQLLLLSAAGVCGNIAFAAYVCQSALSGDLQITGSNKSHNAVQRLAQVFPWLELVQIFGAGAGDAVDWMSGRSSDPINGVCSTLAALSVMETDEVIVDTSERLRHFDDRLFASANGCKELKYAASLFDNLTVSEGSRNATQASTALFGLPASKLLISDRFLERRLLYKTKGLVTNKIPNLSVISKPSRTTDALLWKELTDSQKLAGLEACVANGFVSSDTTALALRDISIESLIPQDTMRWKELATACVVARTYNSGSLGVSEDSSIVALFAQVSELDCIDASFVLPFLRGHDTTNKHCSSGGINIEDLDYAGPDRIRAKEALLYHLSGRVNVPNQQLNELYTQVLMDGGGKIRFTGTGTFDPASRFISQMSVYSLYAPMLQTSTLSARAIEQLAPYIPQLFAMLCFQNNGVTEASSLVSESACAILELLTASTPDIIMFYAVVASGSLPAASKGKSLVAKLLAMLDTVKVADVRCFLDGVKSATVIPQERMRWACTKAKSAHLKGLTAYQQLKSKESAGPRDNMDDNSAEIASAVAAINESLQRAHHILDDYSSKELFLSQAEKDFVASIPQIRVLLARLRFSNELVVDNARLEQTVDQLWSEVFAILRTPATLPLEYISPVLANFLSPIPIPALTHPTKPLYFCQAGDTVRIIGSKTRPKLLVFHLRTYEGSDMQEKYILKGSEDLRVDESAMQMFIRLNRVSADSVIQASNGNGEFHDGVFSKLAVYNVVPTSAYGGLIQVVDHAPSLFNIYTQYEAAVDTTSGNVRPSSDDSAGSDDSGRSDVETARSKNLPPPRLRQIFDDHARPILERAGQPIGLPFEKWPGDIINAVYESASQTVPPDLLHKQLLQTAQSSAHLYLITRNMVRSIGMASIAGYVLGLGDRHLDNLLVRLESAQLVQIDFNVCYDFGSISNIPEQVPFRLSPILTYLCGTPDLFEDIRSNSPGVLDAVRQRPFALSEVFLNAATATIQYARMDREALVNAIMSRMRFWPFMEWCLLEKSWLQDCKHNQGNCPRQQDSLLLDQSPPKRLSSDSVSLWSTPHAVSVKDFVQSTGLCPPNAFWPREIDSEQLSLTEMPFGWRLARAAVDRIRARLDFKGMPGQSQGESSHDQTMVLWEVATSKSRLARMYTGWAPWI
ncbi:Serine/threonine-protein kinase smg1 [Coemansia sp. RSA 988]|nr:Serine/threonine-protein kinase smg1 [Coemansia sp. RSA 988]